MQQQFTHVAPASILMRQSTLFGTSLLVPHYPKEPVYLSSIALSLERMENKM